MRGRRNSKGKKTNGRDERRLARRDKKSKGPKV
jgi:hypothetical protein